ncbi:MAG TPA: ABC transporter substrate-binding protein [Gemmataceae bacterium]|nr:ABC transporter substrate-binding protein [Gemmataceae bacterium]
MPSPRWLSLGFLALILASASWVSAQPPRKEEEEEPKEKARPVVPVPVAEPEKKDTVPAADSFDPDVGTFKEELAKATHPDAKDLFRALLIPYDRIQSTFRPEGGGGTTFYIELFPSRELPEEEFEVKVLDGAKKNSIPKKLSTGSGFHYTPFELIVLEQVKSFLAKTETMEKSEQLDFASRAVAAGIRWHLVAVSNNKRVGKSWEGVAATMKARLLDLMLERFRYLAKDLKKYDRADEVGLKMLSRFPDNNEVLREVYWLQLMQTNISAKGADPDFVKLREALVLYERLPGKRDEGLMRTVRARLRDRAKILLALAKDDDTQKMTAAAIAKLRTAETIDPDLPGIDEARTRLKGKVLYVGVAKLPELMSPAAAVTDAERWATELMFEGLLETIPDAEVVHYRPALAEGLPAVMPLGRTFTLPRNVRWARDTGEVFDARDVRGTLELTRRPEYRDRWCYDGLDVFQSIDRIDDPFRLRLAYDRGVLEPLSRATFKVIPARHLQELDKRADDAEFARAPFGTGPFRYEGREKEGPDREYAVFRMNPFYGQRAGKFGLPWIREIRLYVPNQSTLIKDVPAGQLHLYPDAPGELIPRFRTEAGLKDTMRVYSAKTNRRIHVLAINHRQTVLQNDKLRQGLSAAINRDGILKEVFRGGRDEKVHEALTGPFPVRSWATPVAARDSMLYKPGAGGLIADGLGGRGPVKLGLLYEADDPKNALVCQRIKAQIEEASANKDGKPTVQIELQALPGPEYRNKLHREFTYDLALSTFDYRDDLYSLASLLDPEATGRGMRNFLGYLASGTNAGEVDHRLRRKIEETRQHRDFTAKVRELTWDIHTLFNQRVPFVPLWQLDRFMVVHKDLKIHFDNPNAEVSPEKLDPAVIFTGVEMWRLD